MFAAAAIMQKKGVILQKDGRYTVKVLTKLGYLSATQLIALSDIAVQYTKTELFFTPRGAIELSDIEPEQVNELLNHLQTADLQVGGTGATVRAVAQCKGATCKNSLLVPGRLAQKLEEAFTGEVVPKKFKLAVFGCRNSTGKAMANDVGIVAANVHQMYHVYIGGMAGHNVRQGVLLNRLVKESEILPLVRHCLDFYKQNALEGERFGQLLDRLHIDIDKEF